MTISDVQTKLDAVIVHLKAELAQIRTGRASASLVSDIEVDAYDSKLMVKELGQITTPEPNVILISPWDKSILTNIVGGITKANVGLNAVVDGDIIRIVIPPLTSERREQFIKQMHGILEKFRVEVRQIRHQYLESVKTDRQSGRISEDDEEREKHEIQKLHDEYIEAIEVAGKIKEEQLREV
ncbi:ribosome recycling factor [Candidatus Curtissbacteria bacterium RIFCSPLOWO2_02_FULL_40_11]|uniref:Ribosome recycling factor n=2 Tax=Candidatus Curtissiibacteriota TaxID=1752717 RepID=A0A1F5ID27_9BACT|nr:MAG: ribosome recycling factor [Candidatus Curtissbacteria bacterium RIFCSPLOWO2_02_FULL_40_11]OGE14297.1 MAG: ribosome recycling factor [Candidatus Curtissbacteria bacterium RIFCSPLOWO2_12_FULL_38_9]